MAGFMKGNSFLVSSQGLHSLKLTVSPFHPLLKWVLGSPVPFPFGDGKFAGADFLLLLGGRVGSLFKHRDMKSP